MQLHKSIANAHAPFAKHRARCIIKSSLNAGHREPADAHKQQIVQPVLERFAELASKAGACALAALLTAGLQLSQFAEPAYALLNSPNAQIARSVDAALRRSIPAFNSEVSNQSHSSCLHAYHARHWKPPCSLIIVTKHAYKHTSY